jgi:GUN4-like
MNKMSSEKEASRKTSLGKLIGAGIAGVVTISTIAAAILQPEEARSCVILDARGCPFLRVFASGKSEVGADYAKLGDFLQKQDFQQANQETGRLILWLAAREKDGDLDPASMKRLPCSDLRIIDQLWSRNSNKRFGFTVQQSIYKGLRKTYKDEGERNEAFGATVGWRTNEKWLNSPEDLIFELRAPLGHLPSRYGKGAMKGGWVVYPIVSGLATCDLEAQ